MQSGNEKTRLQVERHPAVPPKNSCGSILAFLRYAADEIPVSFPYRDMGTIRELYRRVIEKISGFLWEQA